MSVVVPGRRRFDAVLFDVGGVLTSPLGALMTGKLAESGLSGAEFLSFGLGPLDVDGDHPFHRIERGEISLAECEAGIQALIEAGGGTSTVRFPGRSEIATGLHPAPDMLALVAEVRRAGYQTAIVSNCIREWDGWSDIFDSTALVDVVIDSCQVGLRKPDPRIYALALTRLGGIDPSRAVFMDDFPWNLPSAQNLGITTVQCADQTVAAAELRALLELPPPAVPKQSGAETVMRDRSG